MKTGRGRKVLDTHLFTQSTPLRPVVAPGITQVRDVLSPIGAVSEETDTLPVWLARFRGNLALERIRPLARSEAATAVRARHDAAQEAARLEDLLRSIPGPRGPGGKR